MRKKKVVPLIDHYLLKGEKVVKYKGSDVVDYWRKWQTQRYIQSTNLILKNGTEVCVSTIFLGIDHRYSTVGKHLLFETMSFGKKNQFQERCSTYKEAIKQHEDMVSKFKYVFRRDNRQSKAVIKGSYYLLGNHYGKQHGINK
ncbi:MAG: hypothetical protein KW793_03630 [Candidatus Doudnabacteria bacterium]|nr:hypothetical protein [Candidatus Doudnabacteria bacterium]